MIWSARPLPGPDGQSRMRRLFEVGLCETVGRKSTACSLVQSEFRPDIRIVPPLIDLADVIGVTRGCAAVRLSGGESAQGICAAAALLRCGKLKLGSEAMQSWDPMKTFPNSTEWSAAKPSSCRAWAAGDPRRADRGPPACFRPGAGVCKVWIFIGPGR